MSMMMKTLAVIRTLPGLGVCVHDDENVGSHTYQAWSGMSADVFMVLPFV